MKKTTAKKNPKKKTTVKASLLGKKAPPFALEDKNGETYTLNCFDSDFLVVYFYPRDNTPGCTIEAKEFSKDLRHFKKLKTEVVGISGGDNKTKTKFCKDHKLRVLLLSDPDHRTAKKYKAFGEKQFMGRKFMGIFRRTYLLDKKRSVVKEYCEVTPAEHSKEIRQDIAALRAKK